MAENVSPAEVARKQRHLYLLGRVRQNQTLTPAEIEELADYEAAGAVLEELLMEAALERRWQYLRQKVRGGQVLSRRELRELKRLEQARPRGGPDAEPGGGPEGVAYSFGTRSRCPVDQGGCGSLDTHATETRGQVQHRVCRQCGHRYKEIGTPV